MAHELSNRDDLRPMGWHSPQEIHWLAESMRRAFAVRNHFLGDPDFVTIPSDRLLSQPFADSLSASIRPDSATPSARSSSFPTGAGVEGKHTTHFSVVDGQGNAVALTTTINNGFGSASTVGGAGFLLNNEMDDFTAQPGVPNGAGLVQGDANAIVPGKRMLSSMTPTIVLDHDGKPMIVTGASGSGRIITLVFQVISNVVDFGMGINAAVSAPRVHHQHLPDTLLYERSETHRLDDRRATQPCTTRSIRRGADRSALAASSIRCARRPVSRECSIRASMARPRDTSKTRLLSDNPHPPRCWALGEFLLGHAHRGIVEPHGHRRRFSPRDAHDPGVLLASGDGECVEA